MGRRRKKEKKKKLEGKRKNDFKLGQKMPLYSKISLKIKI